MQTGSQPAERLAACLSAAMFGFDGDEADELLTTETGCALLALLANAGAKIAQASGDQALTRMKYEHKELLLRRAIRVASDWWATPHAYGETYAADTVIYIETPFARFSFHCRRADPYLSDLLAQAPTSMRGWNGVALQPYAAEITRGFLDGIATAAEVIDTFRIEF